jgi:hypothetical protein
VSNCIGGGRAIWVVHRILRAISLFFTRVIASTSVVRLGRFSLIRRAFTPIELPVVRGELVKQLFLVNKELAKISSFLSYRFLKCRISLFSKLSVNGMRLCSKSGSRKK